MGRAGASGNHIIRDVLAGVDFLHTMMRATPMTLSEYLCECFLRFEIYCTCYRFVLEQRRVLEGHLSRVEDWQLRAGLSPADMSAGERQALSELYARSLSPLLQLAHALYYKRCSAHEPHVLGRLRRDTWPLFCRALGAGVPGESRSLWKLFLRCRREMRAHLSRLDPASEPRFWRGPLRWLGAMAVHVIDRLLHRAAYGWARLTVAIGGGSRPDVRESARTSVLFPREEAHIDSNGRRYDLGPCRGRNSWPEDGL